MKSATGLWDIVIVGGGLSGLALAAELAAPEFAHLSVLVLEQRTRYTRDRTWSYWRETVGQTHRYQHLERARWSRWSVGMSGRNSCHPSSRYCYATLDADAFYQAAQHSIGKTTHVQLRLGTQLSSIRTGDAALHITLANSQTVGARHVFDARPAPHGQTATGTLVQQFAGWEVHTQHDAFDASTVQLMAFEPHAQGLHFWYVLPYGPRQALVETTWVSPASWQPDFTQELQTQLAQRLGAKPYTVVYREQGVLDLSASPPASTRPGITALGRGGGTLRPSTGYAFLDSLAHAQRLAESLRQALNAGTWPRWQPPAFERPPAQAWMDAVFLSTLANDWARAPHYFCQLFERVPPDTLVAFLAGQPTLVQCAAVMQALPMAPFAAAAVQRGLGWRTATSNG